MNLIFKKIWNKSLGCCVVVSENTKNSGKGSQVTGSVQQPSKIASNIQLFKLKPLVVATGLSLMSLVSQQVFAEQVITCGAQGSNNNPSIATAGLNNTIISQQYWGTLYCLNQPSGTLVSDNKLLNDDLNVTISTDTLKVGVGGITSKGTLGNDPGNGSISFNSNKITNLLNGTSSNDAVNFGQLNSVANVFGGGSGFSGGVFTGPTYTIQGSNYTNIGSAFTAVNTKLTNLQSQLDALPGGGGADGKSAYEIAVDNGYVGSQTQWLASLKGDKGDKGDVGATGAQGIQGDKGDKGDTGAQGIQGVKGDKGDVGATGAQGIQGDKGDKGDVGATGAQGIQGVKGDKGDTGAQGIQGVKGDKGDTGAQGIQGVKGDTGAQGKSAYEVAVDNGYNGTEKDWLTSQSGNSPYLDVDPNTTSIGAKATGTGATALGDGAVADGNHNTVVGSGASAKGESNTVVGKGNNVKGNRSGAFGDPNLVQGDGSYAVGNDNTINSNNSFVIGNNVNTSAKNSVVLGNDSASTRDNTVSVGASGKERQIIHVAAGIEDTDAVNVKQMKDGNAKVLTDAKAYTDTKVLDLENSFRDTSNRIDQTNHDVRKNREIAAQGIAGITAMANIPMPAEQGASTVGLGMGHFDSQSAIAVGASHYFENGVAVKGAFSSGFNNGNTTTVGAGVSYTWK